jgi:hypothetical protein
MFVGSKEGKTYVKMKKLRKKKSLTSSLEGPFLFMKHLDENEFLEHDGGRNFCHQREA